MTEENQSWGRGLAPNKPANSGVGTAFSISAAFGQPMNVDNRLITPQLAIPEDATFALRFFAATQDVQFPKEHLAVYISTTIPEPAAFIRVWYEIVDHVAFREKFINLVGYANQRT